MKKNVYQILSLILLAGLFTACKFGAFTSHTKEMEMVGNPTTGYTWVCNVGDDGVVQVDENIQYLGKEDITGAPSLYMYKISSLKPGNTVLKFEYKRYWETTDVDQVKYYEVTVKENGKLTIKENKDMLKEISYKSVSMDEGLKLMAFDTDYVLLDVRTPEEYAAGHIPGAVQLTNETFTEGDAKKVISDKVQRVYVYCRSGRRSKNSSQKLVDFGYTDVIEIGGILDYSGEIEK